MKAYFHKNRKSFQRHFWLHASVIHQKEKAPTSPLVVHLRTITKTIKAYIFLISRLGIFMQLTTSGNSATMSLLLMVIFATIFFKAIFLAE